MLKITFALGIDQVSVQTKIEIFEVQILTLWDIFVDGNILYLNDNIQEVVRSVITFVKKILTEFGSI
jgi:hypothetical protein